MSETPRQSAWMAASQDEHAVSAFADSYASFNRIVNSLQRQYLELKDEFAVQNEQLVRLNKELVALSSQNLNINEFLNGLLESVSAGIIAVDNHGRITHFNPAASRLLGIPSPGAVGEMYREIVPPGEPIDANALRAFETRKANEGIEKRIELHDGTKLHVSVATALLKNKEDVVGAVEIFHDVSHLKRMEQEIARLNTLAALGQMAATIAHQVRNPLAGIGGFASLLKRDMPDTDPRVKMVDNIIRGVNSLDETVTSLLTYTRQEELRKEPVDLIRYLAEVVDHFKQDSPDLSGRLKITIQESHRPLGAEVLLDRILCRQVFINLLTNAAEATQGTGTIVLTARLVPKQLAGQQFGDRIMLSADETVVEISISDNGPGISEHALPDLFAPFFTTKKQGTGLGLAMSAKIIKAHAGEIVARNREQGGAEFLILLPVRLHEKSI